MPTKPMDGMDCKVALPDGRSLSYAEWGPRDGFPVFGFHGTPNSRLVHFGCAAPETAGVHLILVDRPGFGLSDPQVSRTLLDWPNDVAALADEVDASQFAVFGVSGGGPHAAACGFALPDRVTAVGLVSSTGPGWAFDAVGDVRVPGAVNRRRVASLARVDLGAAHLEIGRACRDELRQAVEATDEWLDEWAQTAPPADQAIISEPEVRLMYARSVQESARQGDDHYAHEVGLLWLEPWGFELDDIASPVVLWHGDADPSAPIEVARAIVATIPRFELREIAGAGHLLAQTHAEEILTTLRELSVSSPRSRSKR